jgi:hypothetical protein
MIRVLIPILSLVDPLKLAAGAPERKAGDMWFGGRFSGVIADQSGGLVDARHPRTSVLWGLALAGCATAAASVALAFASDHLPQPGLRAALLDWVLLPYIFAGLIAWWRRPESRLGPLMVAGGFTMSLSCLQWANAALPYTVGLVFDLLPVAVYLHVFLAFPSGLLERPSEAAAYSVAIGLQIVKMLLGGGGPDNLLVVTTEVAAANRWRTFSCCLWARCALPESASFSPAGAAAGAR